MREAHDPVMNTDISPDIKGLVRQDKLKLLFRQSLPSVFISYATALLLSWMLWGHTSDVAIVAWLVVLALSSVGRLVVFITYLRNERHAEKLLRLERPYVVSLMISSLIWGIGTLIIMPADSLLYQAITLCILVGMAGGAVSMYSARYLMVIGSMTAVLLPCTIWLFFQDSVEQIGLAIGASAFMLFQGRAAKVLAKALQSNFQLGHELHMAHDAAERQAKTDPLTGINNRRAFFFHCEQIIHYCERHELPLSVLLIDVDHFKTINDALGHMAGDVVLQRIGKLLLKSFRRSDVCGRIGGEEFAAALLDTSESDAQIIAEKLRRNIAEMSITYTDQSLNITVSIGVADGSYDFNTLLDHADMAMYRAKEKGRNQVIRYAELDAKVSAPPISPMIDPD